MGGGGRSTTNVQTGLGDDQFAKLSANQKNIATSIDADRLQTDKRFDQADASLSSLNEGITGVGTRLDSGFMSLQDLMDQNMQTNQTNFSAVNENINQATGQIQTGLQSGFEGVNTNLASGFGDMNQNFDVANQRFDRLDAAQQDAQTAIDTGFQDQTNSFSDLNTRLSDDFNTAQETMTDGFSDVGQRLSDVDANTQTRLDTVQNNVLTGQALLDEGLNQMSDTQNVYYEDLSGRQQDIQQGQDEFRTTFDDYVQRYSDDTTLANQTRADIQQGLVNATDFIRDDLANYSQVAAQNSQALSGQISDTAGLTGQGLQALGEAVQGGFSEQAMASQQAQSNLATRLGNLNSLVDTVGTTIDSNTRQQYQSLASSFDAEGNLIRNSIDAQGNTIQRSFDDQGNLVISRFDQAGNQIGSVNMNVNQMLTNAEQYQRSLQTQIGGFQSETGQGFNQVQQALGTGFDAAQQYTSAFFDAQRGAITQQGADIINNVGSRIGNLDQASQQQYQALSQSFDQNGNLVTQSMDQLGNSISRQIDRNGNLTISTLDRTGQLIDQNNYNVTGLLSDLGTRTGVLQQAQMTVADRLDQGFASMSDIQTQGFNQLGQGQTQLRLQAQQGFSDTAQGLMSAQRDNMGQFQRMSADIMSGFDAANGVMDAQTRDLANIAAQQGNLDMGMRQQFNQIGQAFDDNGRLIRNTIMDNGTVLSREIDQNGNLLLRAFDATGRTIGNQVVNINRALIDLSQLDYYAGANVSMGNLSPAMQGDVPTEGFAASYSMTR